MASVAVVVAWLCCAGRVTAGDEAVARPPNLIVVLMDDLGWADLGCYGSTWHRTPRLDRWAATGTRFTQAYAASPVCSPTRAALLTGRWPARLQITDWIPGRPADPAQRLRPAEFLQQLPLAEVTLAERLQAAGYATASIGKWHLGGEGFEPTRQGFDLNIAGDRRGTPLDYFSPYRRDGRVMPGLEHAPPDEYLTDRLTDEAIAFMDRNRERPFFLYLSHFAVHVPLRAPKSLVERYPAAEPFRGRQNNPVYAAMLERADTGFGRLLDRLQDRGLEGRTIIVFTSDNGGQATTEGPNMPPTSNAPLRDGKGFLYEGGIRVPLVIAGPGVRSGHVSAFPTSTVDLVPTLLELCHVVDDRSHDGVSLAAVLAGHERADRPPLYWHYPHYANHASRPGGAIRVGDHKLIEFYDTGRRELFDVVTDPGERRNLVEQEPERVRELAGKFDAWRTKVSARMPRPNPDYHPNPQDADGFVVMPARHADVHGVMLRFEPMPHKNTLGYWVRAEDWAEWQFEITRPGRFDLEVSQGCGEGSGGAEVIWAVDGQSIGMIVEETGGFQDFVPRRIGTIALERPGRYTLTVTPKTKPGPAVMDVRQVRLIPR